MNGSTSSGLTYNTAPSPTKTGLRTTSGLTPFAGFWGIKEAQHLAKRTLFGASKADIEYFKDLGLDSAVEELLAPTPLPAPPLKDYQEINGAAPVDANIAIGQSWVNDLNQEQSLQYPRRQSFQRWWIGLILNQERNLREKMTIFWHNHFATNCNEVGISNFVYKHHSLLRENALGNFKNILKPITLDPAMLIYLNGYLNVSHSPDENYAREFQELFTLGKENNPNYTEDDVKAAARVLTGWGWDWSQNKSFFNQWLHDNSDKQFSSFYNNTVISGEVTNGEKEVDALIDMIMSKSIEVARFIVRKLYRYFCYYKIDAATATNVIEPLAQIFINSNWEIAPVLSTLLKSEHFFDAANRGSLIKSPIELTAGLCRELGIKFPDPANVVKAYSMYEHIFWSSRAMNQELGSQPNVAGWPAYYQSPTFNRLWINSTSITERNIFIDRICMTGYMSEDANIQFDPIAFAKSLPNAGDPNQLVNDAVTFLFSVPLADNSKTSIKNEIILTGQANDYYWTNAWNTYLADPTNDANFQIVQYRLLHLFKYLMNLPEYQLQ